ncbi:MAG: hypothetical protein V4681_02455 [Patescibacteria group bacterium]
MSYITEPRFSEKEAADLGRVREKRFFDAVHCHPINLPFGVHKFDHATPQEDRDGYDAWAVTKYGRLGIQIKSSRDGVQKYRKNRPGQHVIFLVVYESETWQQIQRNICEKLQREMEILRQREEKRRRTARW